MICTQRSRGILIGSINLQLNHELRALWDIRLPPEAACVLLYDLLAEMQTEPHSVCLRSLIGLEHAIRHLRSHTRTVVFNLHDDSVAARGDAYDHTPARVRPLRGRVDRVGDEIVQNLLDLDSVRSTSGTGRALSIST